MTDLPKQAEKLAKSHARSISAVSEQTWANLRKMEAQSKRNRNWRVAVIVVVLAAVYALAAYFYAGVRR